MRTSAEGKKVAELNHELKTLVQAFEDACAKAQRSEAPALVFEEENRVVGMLRDVFSPSFENIYVNDPDIHAQIVKYVTLIAPERADIVKLYSKDMPIFDNFSVTRQIKSSFGKTVSFKSGAYIIIEHTEALHVIDVNSATAPRLLTTRKQNALEVNLRAADGLRASCASATWAASSWSTLSTWPRPNTASSSTTTCAKSWPTTGQGTIYCRSVSSA